MEEKFISRQTLNFLLFEMLEIQKLSEHEYFNEYNKEALDMVLGTANKMAVDLMRPCLREMDKNPPVYKNGTVHVNPVVKTFMRKCGEIGFISAHFPFDDGGQQLPYSIVAAFNYIFAAANYSLGVYPGLTSGAANLIITFGSPEMKKYYTPKMFTGEWQGTMALTEPEAGSSLSDIKTKALPTGEGFYLMKGQKIFISAGTHDGVDNVINLMLARVEGAPAGVKGISLFVVPKLRGDGQGGLVSNDVTCAGIEHKLGYRGSPITQLSMGESDDCRGWLVGEENKGLSYMFQMMNEERVNVGIGAAGIASAAYYDSLKYAEERAQGRPLNSKNPSDPQCAIINHPDVKRMLLFQKAVSEGSLSLALQVGKYIDLKHISSPEDIEKYDLLLEFLTPIAKSYPSENGILSTSTGLQILGGYGYCEDFNLELFFRDSRIHPIHEGTTGIQGQDLLGRKSTMKKGRALELFLNEIKNTINEAEKYNELEDYAAKLDQAVTDFEITARHLLNVASKGDIEVFLADATLYLEMAGIITIAWQWLMQACCAVKQSIICDDDALKKFYNSKVHTMKFFFKYELPRAGMLSEILCDEVILTAGVNEGLFVD
jgi:butyryl-CoA dehydrogenase